MEQHWKRCAANSKKGSGMSKDNENYLLEDFEKLSSELDSRMPIFSFVELSTIPALSLYSLAFE